MAFTEKIKAEVRKKADFICCWCRSRNEMIEIHHIKPQSDGGSDEIENAAPLCPSCHSKYGNNSDLRKQIRERRDLLYEIVVSPTPSLVRMKYLIERTLEEPGEAAFAWRIMFLKENKIWTFEDNAIYQIEIDYMGSEKERFDETWTSKFPDPTASLYEVYLRINGVIISTIRFISLDGGRYFVPMPHVEFSEDKEAKYYWLEDSLEFKLGQFIREFYSYETLHEVGRRAGVEVRQI